MRSSGIINTNTVAAMTHYNITCTIRIEEIRAGQFEAASSNEHRYYSVVVSSRYSVCTDSYSSSHPRTSRDCTSTVNTGQPSH